MAATQKSLYQDALRLLGDVRLVQGPDGVWTDDVEARYALDDAWEGAVKFVLRQAAWKFALEETNPVVGGPGITGYSTSYTKPTDWLRTHQIYVQAPGTALRCPVDVKEQGLWFASNVTSGLKLRYVSSIYFNPSLRDWPEHFAKVVAAYLAFQVANRVTGSPEDAKAMAQLFSSLLPEAIEKDAVPEDPWLKYQLDGTFLRCSREVLTAGYWRFAMKTAEMAGGDLGVGTPIPGFPYCAALPADWAKTHGAFIYFNGRECPIDIREDGTQWSTDQKYFNARYLSSTLGLDSTKWPEPFHQAVLANCKAMGAAEPTVPAPNGGRMPAPEIALYQKALGDALAVLSEPENQWWRFERDGRMRAAVQHCLEHGRWKFAMKTVELVATISANPDGTTTSSEIPTPEGPGTLSPDYAYAFTVPADMVRPIFLYCNLAAHAGVVVGPDLARDWVEIDYRHEGGLFHANYSPVRLRYLSQDGYDSTKWPVQFRNAVLVWLEYEEVRSDPKLTAVASAKLKFYEEQIDTAEARDDADERPAVRDVGRFVRGRLGLGTSLITGRERAIP